MVLGLFSKKKNDETSKNGRGSYEPAESLPLESDPLKQCVQLERYGLVIANRDRWKNHPQSDAILQTVLEKLDESFALVPEGYVSLPETVNDYPGCPETDFDTQSFLLARHPVTNAQFQKFVDAGGYAELDLWPEDVWPHLIDFKDLSECPAPRFWERGRHNKRLANHPVVGISYFEAEAYAHWAGLRLPTEAEWQMAASWRIRSSAQILRRYPWGDALDTTRCNIWATGLGHTVPVNEFENGAAPNGVLQLVGNVWEWTNADFCLTDKEGRPVVGDMPLKSIRGGAFDTYFPSQATSFFRTGLACLFRMHNVGFRCAMDIDNNNNSSDAKMN
jgi:iron(II)-dependent oxidoreductase